CGEGANISDGGGAAHFRLKKCVRQHGTATVGRDDLEERPCKECPRSVMTKAGEIIDIAFRRQQNALESLFAHEPGKFVNACKVFSAFDHLWFQAIKFNMSA